MKIDLNADLGEGMPNDAELMQVITSCSIACGGHAGDPDSMRRTLALAREAGTSVGAHPSYPDRENFGRKRMNISDDALCQAMAEQIERFCGLAKDEGLSVRHVKPHGALYNVAVQKAQVAAVVADSVPRGLALVGPPGSCLALAADERGIPFIPEGFIDRGYRSDGTLIPRAEPGALISRRQDRVAQALALATRAPIQTGEGPLTLRVKTLCIHGDTEDAVETARAVRAALEDAGVAVLP